MVEVVGQISSIISDYAEGEFGLLDEAHVTRWIQQFDVADREVVLSETLRLLKFAYISKRAYSDFISKGIVCSTNFSTDAPSDFWSEISLCDIQQNGNSQSELVDLTIQTVRSEYGFEPKVNAVSNHHIYVDDFLFTGNRLLSDLKPWITDVAPMKCQVSIVFVGWYIYGQYNIDKQLKKFIASSGKQITFKFWSLKSTRLENRVYVRDRSEAFWPEIAVMELPEARNYIETQNSTPIFRLGCDGANRAFSCEHRTQYEIAMIKAGLKILSYCQDPSPVIKPLGYNRFDGFGFGSAVFSFRNCPNNNPLAFWWGDPNYPPSHPFGKWYPLMQRKTY